MISTSLVVLLSSFTLSVVRANDIIQSLSPAFTDTTGCVTAGANATGSAVTIQDCFSVPIVQQDWIVSTFTRQPAGPVPIRIYGDKCLDVTDGKNADGTKLQLWTCGDGNPNQQWISNFDNTFRWGNTDKCLDLTNGSNQPGTQLQIWTCSRGNTNQAWVVTSTSRDTVPSHIIGGPAGITQGGPFCIATASNTNGAAVAIVECLNSNSDFHTTFPNGNITWTLPVFPLTGQIKTFDGQKCLDVKDGSTTNGNRLQIWDCADGNTNQMFEATSAQIKWKGNNAGKCVDLTNGSIENGNPIQIWDCAVPERSNPNQIWDAVQA